MPMHSHQSRFEIEGISFDACGFQHGLCVNLEDVEYFGQFFYKRNVDVALCVLDYFCCFGHFDGGRKVRTGSNNRFV